MNFNNIIIQGIRDSNHKANLKSYFIREYRKAERDSFYNADDFFGPLLRKVDTMKKDVNDNYEKERKQKKITIKKSRRNELEFRDDYLRRCLDTEGISYDDYKKQQNKYWLEVSTRKLAELDIKSTSTRLNFHTLTFEDIKLIEKGLKSAENEVLSTQQTTVQETKINYTANENALAYILDLYAQGGRVPTNRTEGGLSAKEIKRIGKSRGYDKPDTFYRAVKRVIKYDLNRSQDLQNISKDWFETVKALSSNWPKTHTYLRDKQLDGDE